MVNRKVAFVNAVAVGVLAMSFGSIASAADLSRRPPPHPVIAAPVSPWTGFYVGAHVGGVTADESVDWAGSTDPSGFTGGVQAGYNFQVAPAWLVGIEGELSWTNADGSAPGVSSTHNWYDTVDARLGYILPHGWLIYGKAGAAWMDADYSVGGWSASKTRDGWNVGVGAEYLVAPQWSVKAEYNYLDFGKDNIAGLGVDTQVNQFKVGVNYHFVPGTLFGRW